MKSFVVNRDLRKPWHLSFLQRMSSVGRELAFLPCGILGPGEEAGERLWAPAESPPHPVFSTGQLWAKKITKSFPSGSVVKEPRACQCRRHRFYPWVRKIPWRRKWKPTLVFLPGKSQGQRSLAVYSPWGHKRVRCDLGTKTTRKITRLAWGFFTMQRLGFILSPLQVFSIHSFHVTKNLDLLVSDVRLSRNIFCKDSFPTLQKKQKFEYNSS